MDITCYDGNGNPISRFYQWDTNQTITVVNVAVSPVPEFQFSNKNHQEAINVVPTVSGTQLIALVPDSLLREAEPIHAYIYRKADSGAGRTLGVINIKVLPRPRPDSFVQM